MRGLRLRGVLRGSQVSLPGPFRRRKPSPAVLETGGWQRPPCDAWVANQTHAPTKGGNAGETQSLLKAQITRCFT